MQQLRRGKKRKKSPDEKRDSGRHGDLHAQGEELEEEAMAALRSTTNSKKKQCIRLALCLLKATKEWIREQ